MAKYAEAAPIVLKAIEDGEYQRDAAQKAGINEDTFYTWMKEKAEFSEAVKRAKENARLNAVAKVERSLLERALGFEYEEVRTEYESKPNDDPKSKEKYVPVIKKQSRTKKRVVQDVEAIKFFLTNKASEEWKNRIEQNNTGSLCTDFNVNFVNNGDGEDSFPSSESEVDAER